MSTDTTGSREDRHLSSNVRKGAYFRVEKDLRGEKTFIANVKGNRRMFGMFNNIPGAEPLLRVGVVLLKFLGHVRTHVAVAVRRQRKVITH